VIVGFMATGCGGGGRPAPVIDPGDDGAYAPAIDPDDFVGSIDNSYLPLIPGSRWVYEGRSGGDTERTEVVVTEDRRTVMGIEVTVVRDTVSADGELLEDTFDWFAQDRQGNVWYFGEASNEYEPGGAVSTDGSWEAGVSGALPGIVMPAQPRVGFAYRQEYLEGEAEDMGQVIGVGRRTSVALGDFDGVVVTRDWNPLEPSVIEEKHYAPGVGLVLEQRTEGGRERAELIEYTKGDTG
jgi:hypothetical protein